MEENNQEQKSYYSKKSLWKWILIYAVIAVIAYAGIYYFFFMNQGGQYQNNSQSTNTTNTTASDQNATTVSVDISNFAYNPSTLTIHKGTTVTWTNNDSMAHTVTGDNGGPASQNIGHGGTYSYTFTTVGSFPYHCAIHPNMKATVQVIN